MQSIGKYYQQRRIAPDPKDCRLINLKQINKILVSSIASRSALVSASVPKHETSFSFSTVLAEKIIMYVDSAGAKFDLEYGGDV